ncbi:MAG: response regulator transcription factor [Pseudomonadales bacterium]|nr:response regulator transcription factor [Pseudomonadales bacterium]
MPMQILVVDDHPLFRAGIATVLERLDAEVRVVECPSCEDALAWLANAPVPDLLLLDLGLPGMDGLQGLARLRETAPSMPVVVLSASEDTSRIRQAFAGGAAGYIPKSAGSELIRNALRLVLDGGRYVPPNLVDSVVPRAAPSGSGNPASLTPRQHEVLVLLVRGLSNKEIATHLDLAENTVRVHVAAILRLLGARNRTEAGYAAVRHGLITG